MKVEEVIAHDVSHIVTWICPKCDCMNSIVNTSLDVGGINYFTECEGCGEEFEVIEK